MDLKFPQLLGPPNKQVSKLKIWESLSNHLIINCSHPINHQVLPICPLLVVYFTPSLSLLLSHLSYFKPSSSLSWTTG